METRNTIERARAGDAASTRELCRLLRERVQTTSRHYARLTGMDADDLQQEMWVGVWLGLEQVDLSIGDPLCYLYLRGKWRLLEAVRRSERSRAVSLTHAAGVLAPDHVEGSVTAKSLERALLARLPRPQQAVLRGLLSGRRQMDLAVELGCTPANISYHVRKIRENYLSLADERRQEHALGGTWTPRPPSAGLALAR